MITTIGINHQTASVALREKLALNQEAQRHLLENIRGQNLCAEVVFLSTCNRVELIVLAEGPPLEANTLLGVLAETAGLPIAEFESNIYVKRNIEAVRHLFRVAGGLDSMVLGEDQILGQVKAAYYFAVELGVVGKTFHALFQKALETGKRVRAETKISEAKISVSSVVVDFASKIFYDLRDKTVLAIGTGEMGRLTLQHLHDRGVENIIVVGRSEEKAKALLDEFGGTFLSLEHLSQKMHEADVLLCSAGAPQHLVEPHHVTEALKRRRNRPMFLIDLAVPRNINPEVGRIDNAFLYDTDDLQAIVGENMERRRDEITACEQIVEAEIKSFFDALQSWDVEPLLAEWRGHVGKVSEEELLRLFGRVSQLDENTKEEIRQTVQRINNKVLHGPTVNLKAAAKNGWGAQAGELIKSFFRKKE